MNGIAEAMKQSALISLVKINFCSDQLKAIHTLSHGRGVVASRSVAAGTNFELEAAAARYYALTI